MFFKRKKKPEDVGEIVRIPHLGSRLSNIEPTVALPDSELIRTEIDSGRLKDSCRALLESINVDIYNRDYYNAHIDAITEVDKQRLHAAIALYWAKMKGIVDAQTEEKYMLPPTIADIDVFLDDLKEE